MKTRVLDLMHLFAEKLQLYRSSPDLTFCLINETTLCDLIPPQLGGDQHERLLPAP
jgi:hypothetical protein